MEAVYLFQSPQLLTKTINVPPRFRVLAGYSPLDGSFLRHDGLVKRCCLISKIGKKQRGMSKMRRVISASMNSPSEASENFSQLAPLRLESAVGQFLSQILLSHPHLLPAAVDEQLEQLLTHVEAEKKEESNSSGRELILYRRIAEVKAKERSQVLEEILYALVVQKFVDADVFLVPSMPESPDELSKFGRWLSCEEKFERLHSSEAYELIRNHLSVILGNRMDDSNSIASISKLRIGQVYAASILYGYFLKRVDRRFQLDKSMKTLPWGSVREEEEGQSAQEVSMEEASGSIDTSQVRNSHPQSSFWTSGSFADRIKPCRLRTYVMSLDSETLQRFASLRSKEAFSIIERHREALFGTTEVAITPQGTIDSTKEELITVSFSGLKRLILEAVTFGSFLWEVESYVDSRYHFVTN